MGCGRGLAPVGGCGRARIVGPTGVRPILGGRNDLQHFAFKLNEELTSRAFTMGHGDSPLEPRTSLPLSWKQTGKAMSTKAFYMEEKRRMNPGYRRGLFISLQR